MSAQAASTPAVRVDANLHPVDNRPLRGRSPPPDSDAATVDHRRHSLPPNLLPPSLWTADTLEASSTIPDQAPHGETIRDEIAAAHRAAALRQLNGNSRNRHRPSKSTGAGNTASSHPVVVRTYSGATASEQRQRIPVIQEEQDMGKAELPPVEAFAFDDILRNVESDVAGTLDAIAGICASSRYSLSNHYDVHLPPHGQVDGTTPYLTPSDTTAAPEATEQRVQLAVVDGRHRKDGVKGPSLKAQEAVMRRMQSGSVTTSEPGIDAMVQDALTEHHTALPVTPNSRPARHGHGGSVPNFTSGPASYSLALTAPLAPEVSTGTGPTRSLYEDLNEVHLNDFDTQRVTSTLVDETLGNDSGSHRRRSSLLGNLASWLPWGAESDEGSSRRASRGEYYDQMGRITAENRLRGILGSDATG